MHKLTSKELKFVYESLVTLNDYDKIFYLPKILGGYLEPNFKTRNYI